MKNEMIPVFEAGSVTRSKLLCNARDLHVFLQVGRDFSTWVKDRIEQYDFKDGEDFVTCSPDLGSEMHGGQNKLDYHLTINMAKELAMIENNEVGRQVRRYFIEMEQKAREMLEERANQVQPIEQVKKRLRDTPSFKYMLILQEQSRKIAKQLAKEEYYGVRYNLHCQLRQVNEALGMPTLSLVELKAELPAQLN